jgi:hypothetical protein
MIKLKDLLERMGSERFESVNEGMAKYYLKLTNVTTNIYAIYNDKNKVVSIGGKKLVGDKSFITKSLKNLKTSMGTFQIKSLIQVADKYKGKGVSFDVVESVI